MKRIILTIGIIVAILLNSAIAQTGFSSDPLLYEVLTNYENEVSNVKDVKAIKEYLADGDLTEDELSTFYIHMGYNSHNEMVDFIKNQNDKLVVLAKRYNLSKNNNGEIKDQIKQAYINMTPPNYVAEDCASDRLNCIGAVSAEAAIMHIGCAGLDLTVIMGIICHGAAFTYQITASNGCHSAYNRCRGISQN